MKQLTFEQYIKAVEAAYGTDSGEATIAREVYGLFCRDCNDTLKELKAEIHRLRFLLGWNPIELDKD